MRTSGGHRESSCVIAIALGYRNDADAAAVISGWVNTMDGAYSWYVPALPNGWLMYADLPGSSSIPTSGYLVLSAALGTTGATLPSPTPTAPVAVPPIGDCAPQLPPPVITMVPFMIGGIEAALGPVKVTIALAASELAGMANTAGASLSYSFDAASMPPVLATHDTNVTRVLYPCTGPLDIIAVTTKPGWVDSTATQATAAPGVVGGITCMAVGPAAAPMIDAFGAVLALGAGGLGRDASCNVIVVISCEGGVGDDGACELSLDRVDAGGTVPSVFHFGVSNRSALTLNLGALPGAPVLQLSEVMPSGAWAPAGSPMNVPPQCAGQPVMPTIVFGTPDTTTPGGSTVGVTVARVYPAIIPTLTYVTTDGSDPTIPGGSRFGFNGTSWGGNLQPLPQWLLLGAGAAQHGSDPICVTVRAATEVLLAPPAGGMSGITSQVYCLPPPSPPLALCGSLVQVVTPTPTPAPQSLINCSISGSGGSNAWPIGGGAFYVPDNDGVYDCQSHAFLYLWSAPGAWDSTTETGWTTTTIVTVWNRTTCNADAFTGIACDPGSCGGTFAALSAGATSGISTAPPGTMCVTGALTPLAAPAAVCNGAHRCYGAGEGAPPSGELYCPSGGGVTPTPATPWYASLTWVSTLEYIVTTVKQRAAPARLFSGGYAQACNTQTWIECIITNAEATSRAAMIAAGVVPTACTLSFVECWPGARDDVRPNPGGAGPNSVGCYNGIWRLWVDPICAGKPVVPATPTPSYVPVSPTPPPTAGGGAGLPVGTSDGFHCAGGMGQCSPYFVFVIGGVAGPAQRMAQGTECYNDTIVYSTDTNASPCGFFDYRARRATDALDGVAIASTIASTHAAVTAASQPTMRYQQLRSLRASSLDRSLVVTTGCTGGAVAICTAQCGGAMQWCASGVLASLAAPSGTVCFDAGHKSGATFIPADDARCAAAGATCAAASATLPTVAVCYVTSSAAPAAAGVCTDSYYLCRGGSATRAQSVPAGTACLDGGLVPVATCGISVAAAVSAQLDVRGGGASLSSIDVGALATAIAAAIAASFPAPVTAAGVGIATVGGVSTVVSPLVPSGNPIFPPLANCTIGNPTAPPLGLGRTTINVTIGANSASDAAWLAAALAIITTSDASTGVSPVTAALALAGSQLQAKLVSPAILLVAPPASAPAPTATPVVLISSVAAAAFVFGVIIAVIVIVMRRRRRNREKQQQLVDADKRSDAIVVAVSTSQTTPTATVVAPVIAATSATPPPPPSSSATIETPVAAVPTRKTPHSDAAVVVAPTTTANHSTSAASGFGGSAAMVAVASKPFIAPVVRKTSDNPSTTSSVPPPPPRAASPVRAASPARAASPVRAVVVASAPVSTQQWQSEERQLEMRLAAQQRISDSKAVSSRRIAVSDSSEGSAPSQPAHRKAGFTTKPTASTAGTHAAAVNERVVTVVPKRGVSPTRQKYDK